MSWHQLSPCLAAVAIAVSLAGCSTVSKPEQAPAAIPPLESLVAPHRDKAAQLEAQGDLRGALNEWKVALTVNPKDPVSIQGRQKTY